MAKKFDPNKYDLSQFKLGKDGSLEFREGFYRGTATPEQVRWYNQATGKTVSNKKASSYTRTKLAVPEKYSKLFGKSTNLKGAGGQLRGWSRTLALSGGSNPEYGFRRLKYNLPDGSKFQPSGRYGADLNQLNKKNIGKTNVGKGYIINGSKAWLNHLRIVTHQVTIKAEHFRIAVGHRAIKVFQDSFKLQKFNSAGSYKWAPLSSFTKRKRLKRRTGSRILKEYGDLYNSIKIDENHSSQNGRVTRIYTDKVSANVNHYKKHTICYAGLHNSPKPGETYGRWGNPPKPYIQRQFMGHSELIDTFAASVSKRFLFDDVFLIRQV